MAWVAKKSPLFFIASVLLPVAVGAVSILGNESSIVVEQEAVPIRITCMNLQSELIETITVDRCPIESVSLGEFALTESEESVTVRQEIHPILQLRVKAAIATASLQGVNLYISSGFRTIERQNYLFAEAATPPGTPCPALAPNALVDLP